MNGGEATKSIRHLCPNLRSDKPEDLGAYYRFHQAKTRKKGDARLNLVLIDNAYGFNNTPRRPFQLGNLPEDLIHAYHCSNEFL